MIYEGRGISTRELGYVSLLHELDNVFNENRFKHVTMQPSEKRTRLTVFFIHLLIQLKSSPIAQEHGAFEGELSLKTFDFQSQKAFEEGLAHFKNLTGNLVDAALEEFKETIRSLNCENSILSLLVKKLSGLCLELEQFASGSGLQIMYRNGVIEFRILEGQKIISIYQKFVELWSSIADVGLLIEILEACKSNNHILLIAGAAHSYAIKNILLQNGSFAQNKSLSYGQEAEKMIKEKNVANIVSQWSEYCLYNSLNVLFYEKNLLCERCSPQEKVTAQTVIKVCAVCGLHESKDQELLRCSRCKKIYYCNAECQKKDWRNHKTSCK